MPINNNFAPCPSFRAPLDEDVRDNVSVVVSADYVQHKGQGRKYNRRRHVIVTGVSSVAISNDRDRITFSERWENSVKFSGNPVIEAVIVNGGETYPGPMTPSGFAVLFADRAAEKIEAALSRMGY